ncbi:MAG: glycosyltransferase, partial [Gemmataceae bacterium]
RKPGRDWGVARKIAATVAEHQLDVLHAHQYTPFFYSALAKPLLRRPPKLILTEHGRHYPDVVHPHRRAFNRLVLDHAADAVNACCRFSGQALSRVDGFAGHRIEIIENGIDTARYQAPANRTPWKERLEVPAGRRYLANVARHHPVKDQAMLLRGFAIAAPALPDVDLVMVGDGPLRGELEALVQNLGLRERVRFLGIRHDVPEVLQAVEAFALTSVSEAASLTLLEAMASGLPVIVTNVGGNPEIVRPGIDGVLVPRGDAAACGAAIRDLFTDPARMTLLGQNGRARVFERYQLNQTVAAYHRLYRRLTGI